mmetsp:Transcript_8994/g.25097  ORF Transcript_8994/g.25097 Transcript_8994/m.25097 type:complete len:103 (-) Transcript_8994:153-461(-)
MCDSNWAHHNRMSDKHRMKKARLKSMPAVVDPVNPPSNCARIEYICRKQCLVHPQSASAPYGSKHGRADTRGTARWSVPRPSRHRNHQGRRQPPCVASVALM